MKPLLLRRTIAPCVFALLACTEETVAPDGPTTAISVALVPTADTIGVGGALQLSVAVTGSTNTTVTYRSSATSVATVEPTGLVNGAAVGTATITAVAAADTTKQATSAITVTAVSPTDTAHVLWDGTPRPVASSLRFTALSTDGGDEHCGISSDGSVACWGILVGVDTVAKSPTPSAMTFTSLGTSGGSPGGLACGLTSSGQAFCWGSNTHGQLGNGTTTPSVTPVPVSGGYRFTQIATAAIHACAITETGQTYCWGMNTNPTDSHGNSYVDWNTPTPVATGITVRSVTAGPYHVCVLAADSTAYCWGEPGVGAVGLGYDNAVDIPLGSGTARPVVGGLTFTALSGGGDATCGLVADGSAYCWGANYAGQLGTSPGGRADVAIPTKVVGVPSFTTIRTGNAHYVGWTCGLTAAGTAWCWGATHVPTSAYGDSTVGPAAVAGGTVTKLSVGASSACALAQDGRAWCWGLNDKSQLGRGY